MCEIIFLVGGPWKSNVVLESPRKVLAKWLQFFCEPWIILILLISLYELYWGNKLTKLVCGPSKYQERYFHVFISLFLVRLIPFWFFFWQLRIHTSFYVQRKCLRWSQCLFFIFAFKIDLHSLQTSKRRPVPGAVVGMFSKIHFEKFVILWFRSPGLSKIPLNPFFPLCTTSRILRHVIALVMSQLWQCFQAAIFVWW